MTKSKSSTIAIVVLSVLLAAALASTIVLAAFNASREASVNITFGQGVSLSVTGIQGSDDPYYWIAEVGGEENNTGTVSNVAADDNVTLKAISATVTGQDAYIAVYATITETTSTAADDEIEPSYNSSVIEATQVTELNTATGWMVVGTGSTANLVTSGQAANLIDVTTIFNAATDDANKFANATYQCEVKVAAAATLSELASVIASLS